MTTELTIVTNENLTENNLLSLILTNDIEGLKRFVESIDNVCCANCEIQEKNIRTMSALKAAGFEESESYKQLAAANKDIIGTNYSYNELRRRAYAALDEF